MRAKYPNKSIIKNIFFTATKKLSMASIFTGVYSPLLSFLLLLTTVSGTLFGQTMPAEMYFSADGKILYTGGSAPTGLYNKSIVRNVYLNFAESNYWTLLTNNYATETYLAATMVVDDSTYTGVGVRFRGNTSYMQIGTSQKKSFGIETDFSVANQTLMGYKNLKFNNAHQDASFMREVLYNQMAARHMPIAKGNFIHLYLNNQDWGLYPNIQNIDKTFLDEWFLSNDGAKFRATVEGGGGGGGGGPNWGDGTAGMNYLGTDSTVYDNYYTLQSSDISNPWETLIEACYSLNQASSSNYATLKNKIDVDKALWFLACENIFTDDDSYVMKGKMDYMTYYEPETGRTTPLEYDGNSTFVTSAATSSSWSPFKNATNVNYPLLYELLGIPEYRQRYLAHYRTILNETFTTTNANATIDQINAQIAALVASDPKKLYTTTEYTNSIPALKTFVANRRNYLLSNTEVAQVAPTIAAAPYYNSAGLQYAAPVANEQVTVKATVSSTNGINKVNLYYANSVVGNFNLTLMYDDGAHNDGAANDGVYGGTIPGYETGSLVRYYVEAISNNATLSASYLPTGAEHDVFVYAVSAVPNPNGVVINELMASNNNTVADNAGDYDDWVELYNNNNYSVDLSGYYLSDNNYSLMKWQFPNGTIIPANDYLIVWADEEAIEGALHCSWKMSSAGETITLLSNTLQIVDQVNYGTQTADMAYARVPNGIGNFVIQNPTFNASNNNCILNNLSITGNSSTCSNLVQTYSVPAIAGSTYQWTVVGGDIISGQGTNQITVQWANPNSIGSLSIEQTAP